MDRQIKQEETNKITRDKIQTDMNQLDQMIKNSDAKITEISAKKDQKMNQSQVIVPSPDSPDYPQQLRREIDSLEENKKGLLNELSKLGIELNQQTQTESSTQRAKINTERELNLFYETYGRTPEESQKKKQSVMKAIDDLRNHLDDEEMKLKRKMKSIKYDLQEAQEKKKEGNI